MTDPATARKRLDEAEAALHRLNTGTQMVQFSDGEATVQYTPASRAALERYVARLRREAEGRAGRPGPIGTGF